MKSPNQSGFSILHILPVIAIMAVIGIIGVRLMKPSHALTPGISCYIGNFPKSLARGGYAYPNITVYNNSLPRQSFSVTGYLQGPWSGWVGARTTPTIGTGGGANVSIPTRNGGPGGSYRFRAYVRANSSGYGVWCYSPNYSKFY